MRFFSSNAATFSSVFRRGFCTMVCGMLYLLTSYCVVPPDLRWQSARLQNRPLQGVMTQCLFLQDVEAAWWKEMHSALEHEPRMTHLLVHRIPYLWIQHSLAFSFRLMLLFYLQSMYSVKVFHRKEEMAVLIVTMFWEMLAGCIQCLVIGSFWMRKLEASSFPCTLNTMLFRLHQLCLCLRCLAFVLLYRRVFCPIGPKTWKHFPRYLGSKDLILSTLYGTYAVCAVLWTSFSATWGFLHERMVGIGYLCEWASLLHVTYGMMMHAKVKADEAGTGKEKVKTSSN